ncbi:Lrp/AsnC family transcriptional regulator [Labrys wisconsinensis]|uniref:DNA-binding Lrp family transcriptional regulator n=1 Tax=Labrys wisconsinensis TaxID=425677 RepID=A0ABU0J4E5_9HYPH|nr:Lrp/AsnC family transcriptional regulator [Labrys wisconsinensis]MDQ0468149.1 DNA-binding Lrp family transcriptional regulator [Labrys wisconsinensis]
MTTEADRALIALLRENARLPLADLARRLGLSRTTVQSRLARLERSGVIRGYTVRLSDEHEKAQVVAHVLVTALPKFAPAVMRRLEQIPEVRRLHSVSGAYDMIVEIEAPSIGALDALIDGVGAMDGVERTMSSIILSTKKG